MTTRSIGQPRPTASNNDIDGEDARGGRNTTNIECCVCLEDFQQNEATRVDCGHGYCHDCVKELFTRSLHDQILFPPKCCGQEIQLALVKNLLNEDEIQDFQNRYIEHTTAHRVYCGNRACGAFIRPELITGDRARCTGCLSLTCTLCMCPFHFGADCPEDPAILNTLALANQEGWQRCYSCGTVVQLSQGCNHMTCHCGAQFCYRCGARWRTCACRQWEEGQMFPDPEWVMLPPRDHGPPRRGGHRNRNNAARGVRRPPRADPGRHIPGMRDMPRHMHNCVRFWRRYHAGRRGFQCELCHSIHRWYILECRQCGRRLCERCRVLRI